MRQAAEAFMNYDECEWFEFRVLKKPGFTKDIEIK